MNVRPALLLGIHLNCTNCTTKLYEMNLRHLMNFFNAPVVYLCFRNLLHLMDHRVHFRFYRHCRVSYLPVNSMERTSRKTLYLFIHAIENSKRPFHRTCLSSPNYCFVSFTVKVIISFFKSAWSNQIVGIMADNEAVQIFLLQILVSHSY